MLKARQLASEPSERGGAMNVSELRWLRRLVQKIGSVSNGEFFSPGIRAIATKLNSPYVTHRQISFEGCDVNTYGAFYKGFTLLFKEGGWSPLPHWVTYRYPPIAHRWVNDLVPNAVLESLFQRLEDIGLGRPKGLLQYVTFAYPIAHGYAEVWNGEWGDVKECGAPYHLKEDAVVRFSPVFRIGESAKDEVREVYYSERRVNYREDLTTDPLNPHGIWVVEDSFVESQAQEEEE